MIELTLAGPIGGETSYSAGMTRVESNAPRSTFTAGALAWTHQGTNRIMDLLSGPFYELFGMGTSRFELESFFGVPPECSRRVAWASAGACCKNWNLQRVVRRFGLEAAAELLDWARGPQELCHWHQTGQPLILVTWHSGAPYGVAAGLWKIGIKTLFLVGPPPPFPPPDGLTYVATEGDGLKRAEALHGALRHLRDGGAVYVVADHPTYSKTQVPMWGRQISFAPSIGMLARVSGAMVIPILSRWTPRGRIEIKYGDPFRYHQGGPDDLYRRVGEWFEAHFLAHPEELEPKYLMKLIFSPPAGGES
jgi:Bacterial lipid A biosynthesis acyltransferase